MSDSPMFPSMLAVMSPERARDIGRLYQALSEQFEASGSRAHAQRATAPDEPAG